MSNKNCFYHIFSGSENLLHPFQQIGSFGINNLQLNLLRMNQMNNLPAFGIQGLAGLNRLGPSNLTLAGLGAHLINPALTAASLQVI